MYIDEALVAKDRFELIDDRDVSLCIKGAGARLDRRLLIWALSLSRWCASSGTAGGRLPRKSPSSEPSTGMIRGSNLSLGVSSKLDSLPSSVESDLCATCRAEGLKLCSLSPGVGVGEAAELDGVRDRVRAPLTDVVCDAGRVVRASNG